MKQYYNIFLLLLAASLTGCMGSTTTTTTTSSVAQLTAFSFNSVDSMPGLGEAVFTVEERIDTGLVYNKDSIRYGTSLERVVPRFVFKVAVGSARLQTPDTSLVLTGYDTLDFSKQPIYLTLKSTDGTTTKVYEIRPTVHQADPDLYTWTCLNSGVYPEDESEQRVLELGNDFVMLSNNGFENAVYRSADGQAWASLGEPIGLPYSCRVRQIVSDGYSLYYADGTTLYTSDDGLIWTTQTMPYEMKTMLMTWNDLVWALVDNGGLELATIDPMDISPALRLTGLRPEGDFPVSDFATVAFHSASLRARAMIIGGFAENGRSLNARWNLEYSEHIKTHGGYRLSEYSIDRPTFTTLTGVSVVWYDDKLLLFGGVDKEMTYFGRDILVSTDEGLNWTKADTTKNQLPEVYQARQKQTAIVRDNDIYLFGGQDARTTYSDVYRGRLNSIDW